MIKVRSAFIDPSLIEPHFSTRIYKGYLLHLKKKIGVTLTETIVSQTGLSLEYLENEQNWVSEKFAENFYQKLFDSNLLEENFSYEAAISSLSKEALGPFISIAIQFQTPKSVYSQILKFTKQYNRVDELTQVSLTSNSLGFFLKIRRPTKFQNEIIQNWRGFLSHIPTIFGGRAATVTFKSHEDGTIGFDVNWTVMGNFRLQFSWLAFVFSLLVFPWLQGNIPSPSLSIFGAVFSLGHFFIFLTGLFLLFQNYRKSKELEIHYNQIIEQNEQRFIEVYQNKTKLDRRYREANLLRQVINTITKVKSEDGLITTTLKEVKDRLSYDRVIYFSADPGLETIGITHALGFDNRLKEKLLTYQIELNQKTQNVFHLGNVFKGGKSLLVPVASDYIESLSPEGRALIQAAKTQSFLVVPVKSEKESFGILLVDYATSQKTLNHDDLHIIENVAIQLGIAIQNVRNFETEKNLRLTFQKFVPEPILKKILSGETEGLKKGFKKDVTVLFSDLRDFTKNSTHTNPEDLVELLNAYFNEMTRIVYEEGGIVDKFLGDGLFAIFNAFESNPDDCEKAVKCASRMQKKIAELNRVYFERNSEKFPPLMAGIGIHTGPVTLCTLGNDAKTEFTAIGETVNIAARLEGKSKELGHIPIVFSENVKNKLPNSHESKDLGSHSIRGLSSEIRLFGAGENRIQEIQKNNFRQVSSKPHNIISFDRKEKSESPAELRFQGRTQISTKEPFKIFAKSGNKVVEGHVRDITSFGCKVWVNPESLSALDPTEVTKTILSDVEIFMNQKAVGNYSRARVVRHSAGELAVEFQTEGDPNQKRILPRIGLIPGFECDATLNHPLRFDSSITLKGYDFSSVGASFTTSARNSFFFNNLLLENLELSLRGGAKLHTDFRIKSVKKLGDDRLRIGGVFENKIEADFDETFGNYLCAFGLISGRPRIKAVQEAGFEPRQIKNLTEFLVLSPEQDIRKAIEVRQTAYTSAGKFDPNKEGAMTDSFDKHSFIVLARLGSEDIGTVRVTYCESNDHKFELENSISLPHAIDRLATIEVSRLAVLPSYQKTDIVLGLVQRAIEVGIKLNVRNVITSCTEEKIGIYKNLGFKVDTKAFELKTLAGIPHYFLMLDVLSVVPTGSRNPFAWHFTYGPVVEFLKKFGHYAETRVSFLARIGKILLPLLKKFKKSKPKKPISQSTTESKKSSKPNAA